MTCYNHWDSQDKTTKIFLVLPFSPFCKNPSPEFDHRSKCKSENVSTRRMRVHSWHVDGQCNLNNCLKLSYGELEFTVLLGIVFFATHRQNSDLLSFERPQLRRVVKSHLGFYNLAQSGESFGINLRIKRHLEFILLLINRHIFSLSSLALFGANFSIVYTQ